MTALKTLTLRLRGSKTELEEMGEDVSDMATTTSALQAKLLALTGGQVDIMLDENTFKNSTQILREMADAWEDMTDIQRASALELMGGKRQANVLSALIQNFDTVEDAIEASANSAGSALKENEVWLDSISGKVSQFNNAMQAMWSNTLDSDWVKSFVAFGTEIIKIIDKIGLLNSLLLAFGASKLIPWILMATTGMGTFGESLKYVGLMMTSVKGTGAALIPTIIAQTKALWAGSAGANVFSLSLKTVGIALKTLMATPLGWFLAIGAAIAITVHLVDVFTTTTKELSEELGDLRSELSSLESDIDSLNSELDKTKERMAELIAMPSLSFIEQEELNNLKLTTAELERQLKLKEMLADNKKDAIIATSEQYIDKVWNSSKLDKNYYYDDANDMIREDTGWNGFWNAGEDTKTLLNKAMANYTRMQDARESVNELLYNADAYSEYEKYSLYTKAISGYGANRSVMSEDDFNYKVANDKDFDYTLTEDQLRDWLGAYNERMTNLGQSINTVFADENFEGLEYGMSEDIDAFLDELYAYNLKWQQTQGAYVKSAAISSMFDATSTKEMQEFGKALKEIVNSDLTDEEKNVEILKQLDGIDGVIGDGVNKIEGKTDAYNRLHLAMETVGITAQDIADYFVLETGAFDSNTIEGIANQYQHMESVINALKNMSDNKFTFDGTEYNWSEFFSQDDQGKFKANVAKFSEILVGMDEDSREAFINIVESAANSAGDLSKIDWNQALSKLDFSGIDRTFKLLNDEFEALNNEMFAGAADDINGLIDTVSELQAALEDVASTMDLVHTAQNQMNSSGRISMKTALGLMQTTEDWDKVLEITNGTIKLRDGAEQHLIQTELTAIKTQLHYAWTTAQARYETALAAQGELDYANNSGVVMTAESIKAEAIGRVSAVVVALGAAMDKLVAGEWGSVFSAFGDTYKTATATVVQDSQKLTTSVAELQKDAEEKKKMYDAFSSVDSLGEFKDNYDFDENPGDKYGTDEDSKTDEKMEQFQREMDYWENRIGANQAKYEQIQHEIDMLESQGRKAGAKYYQEQINLENQRLDLLTQQKTAAQTYLDQLTAAGKEGSEEWWEVANTINDIEGELDDVTASIVDLNDAMADTHWYMFDEAHDRVSTLTSDLENIRDILSNEELFDDEGNFTKEGLGTLASYVQELGIYEGALANARAEMELFGDAYDPNKTYVDAYGNDLSIDSEQDWYEAAEKAEEKYDEWNQKVIETKYNIKDLYEQQIDAVEEYTSTLVENYQDYIDATKEALDAERDLYEFKKSTEQKSKNIASIERRIASLSGSTNAADIAERRKLQAELTDAKSDMDDHYYSHSKDQQSQALDDEATAYEAAMNAFIEGLYTKLEESTTGLYMSYEEMSTETKSFVDGVTESVVLNAGNVKDTYLATGETIDDCLVTPWTNAATAIGTFASSEGALGLMNSWTESKAGAPFYDFQTKVSGYLSKPWSTIIAEGGPVKTFKTSVNSIMSQIVSDVQSNVSGISGVVSNLQAEIDKIKDTTIRITTVYETQGDLENYNGGGGNGGGGGDKNPPEKDKTMHADGQLYARTVVPTNLTSTHKTVGGVTYVPIPGTDYYVKKSDAPFGSAPYGTKRYKYYAKGTTGITEDQLAIVDEFGPELMLRANPTTGRLDYVTRGTGIVPADATSELMKLADIGVDGLMMPKFDSGVNMMTNYITKPEFKIDIEEFVHVDRVDQNTLPQLEKMMDKKIDDFSRALNYSLKKFAR